MDGNIQFLRFDGIEIDLAGHRLFRAGVEEPLEPRAFAVLVLMARQPGRAFERDEILDAVWGHTHVTPGTLNRIITLLRHALGEDAQRPRYLHTVHGVGYRFDAQVSAFRSADEMPTEECAPSAAGKPPSGSVEAAAQVASTVANLPFAADLSALSSLPPVDSAAEVGQPARSPPPRRQLAGSLLLLVLLIAGALLWHPWDPSAAPAAPNAPDLPAPPPLSSPGVPVLTVLPLRPLGDDARGAEFADGLSEELINLLARIEGLRVTSRTSSFKFRNVDTPLAEIARVLGATHLLEGSVRQDGARLRIALRLVDAREDRTLWSESYDREFRDIFVVQDSIARAVGDTLQLRFGLRGARSTVDEDPALYRRYLLARRGFESLPEGDDAEVATARLRALTREHPQYARAWGGFASMLMLQYGRGRSTLLPEAEVAAATALRLDPEQPEAHAVLAGQQCREQRWSDCLTSSRKSVEIARSDSFLLTWHAIRLGAMGYCSEALRELESAAQLDPLSSLVQLNLGRMLDTLGRHDEARVRLHLAGLPRAQTALYFNAIWRGDLDEAWNQADSLPPGTPWRNSELLLVETLRDPTRLPELMAAIEHSERQPPIGTQTVSYDFTRFVLPVRDYARDIAGLDNVQKESIASYQMVFWMPGETELRRSRAFQDYLRSSGLLAFWKQNGWPDRCRSDGGDGVVCD